MCKRVIFYILLKLINFFRSEKCIHEKDYEFVFDILDIFLAYLEHNM